MVIIIGSLYVHGGGGLVEVVFIGTVGQEPGTQLHAVTCSSHGSLRRPLLRLSWILHLATEDNLRVSQYEVKLEFINDNGIVGISKGFSVLVSPVKESSIKGLQGRKDPKHPK